MSTDHEHRLPLPWPVRQLPADLAVAIVFAALTCTAVLLPGVRETPLRVVVGFPTVLFFPGYVVVAIIFPAASRRASDEESDPNGADVVGQRPWFAQGIGGLERVAFSVGTSIAVVPLVGYVLNFTPWGIELVPVVLAISGFTVTAAVVAAVRRWSLPPARRFRVPYERWLAAVKLDGFEADSATDTVLAVVLVASVLLAVTSLAYAVTGPSQDEAFTELYLLTENENGTLVAADYPRALDPAANESVHVGIDNHNSHRMNYTVIAALQRVSVENGSVRTLEQRELRRFHASVGPNRTWIREVALRSVSPDERRRLVFLLYDGSPPAEPSVDDADRAVYLWVGAAGRESRTSSESRRGSSSVAFSDLGPH